MTRIPLHANMRQLPTLYFCDDIIGLCSTSFTSKVIAYISKGQYQLTVRDPRTWYQEPERVIPERTVTGTDKQQNICEAISFGWTHELSDAVLNNLDFTEKICIDG